MALPEILKVELEFSSKLGVRELPQLDANNQSNVKGIYVVGDLADAPIIKVALRQGYDVVEHLAEKLGGTGSDPEILDILIIGAGPAGIGAALACNAKGLSYVVMEREKPFATIQNFPKAKLIFSEPKQFENPGNFWFEDATKEELTERWAEALDDHSLRIQQPEEVIDAKRSGDHFVVSTRVGKSGLLDQHIPAGDATADAENTYKARRIVLAGGKRGQLNKLGIPGEERENVHHLLKDPDDFTGKKVVVVGGGDSAVEAACDIADAGGKVLVSYRKEEFARAKARNKARIESMAADGRLELAMKSQVQEIADDGVTIATGGETRQAEADDVLVLIGTRLPLKFLRRLGIKMQGDMDFWRVAWIVSFALITYGFYCLKAKQDLFPFGETHPLGWMHDALKADLGFRTVDASFWGTCIYALLIGVFGMRAYFKYPLAQQKRRYISLIVFQWTFLFGIPELLAPLIIERPWKLYALSVPWPLSIWSLIDAPDWAGGDTVTAVLWLGVGALSAFVLIPLYVRYNGERFCSYMCGCGGLAETLGDFWRHLAPRGRTAKQSEWFGRIILVLAVPVTLLILNDAWGFIAKDALYSTKEFAQSWYGLMVDFWLASVVGVALYPYLGNRVWCRFFCPLRAWMEVLARKFSKITIHANEKCIGCGECTRYCQMGIDVQSFAQRGALLHNGNSSCIQCGICIQVCPMEVLSIERDRPVSISLGGGLLKPPKATWERG